MSTSYLLIKETSEIDIDDGLHTLAKGAEAFFSVISTHHKAESYEKWLLEIEDKYNDCQNWSELAQDHLYAEKNIFTNPHKGEYFPSTYGLRRESKSTNYFDKAFLTKYHNTLLEVAGMHIIALRNLFMDYKHDRNNKDRIALEAGLVFCFGAIQVLIPYSQKIIHDRQRSARISKPGSDAAASVRKMWDKVADEIIRTYKFQANMSYSKFMEERCQDAKFQRFHEELKSAHPGTPDLKSMPREFEKWCMRKTNIPYRMKLDEAIRPATSLFSAPS